MANKRVFEDPVFIHLRIERKTKEEILEHTDNMTEFINDGVDLLLSTDLENNPKYNQPKMSEAETNEV